MTTNPTTLTRWPKKWADEYACGCDWGMPSERNKTIPRPFQFRLRTLFVVIVVTCFFSGWIGYRHRQEQALRIAKGEIARLGGECYTKCSIGTLQIVTFSGTQLTNDQLHSLAPHLKLFRIIDVTNCLVTEASAARLARELPRSHVVTKW